MSFSGGGATRRLLASLRSLPGRRGARSDNPELLRELSWRSRCRTRHLRRAGVALADRAVELAANRRSTRAALEAGGKVVNDAGSGDMKLRRIAALPFATFLVMTGGCGSTSTRAPGGLEHFLGAASKTEQIVADVRAALVGLHSFRSKAPDSPSGKARSTRSAAGKVQHADPGAICGSSFTSTGRAISLRIGLLGHPQLEPPCCARGRDRDDGGVDAPTGSSSRRSPILDDRSMRGRRQPRNAVEGRYGVGHGARGHHRDKGTHRYAPGMLYVRAPVRRCPPHGSEADPKPRNLDRLHKSGDSTT